MEWRAVGDQVDGEIGQSGQQHQNPPSVLRESRELVPRRESELQGHGEIVSGGKREECRCRNRQAPYCPPHWRHTWLCGVKVETERRGAENAKQNGVFDR